MSENQSINQNYSNSSLSHQLESVSYFSSQGQLQVIKYELVQSSSNQVDSSSHEIYDSDENMNKKKKKEIKMYEKKKNQKKSKSKSRSKRKSKCKVKNKETYMKIQNQNNITILKKKLVNSQKKLQKCQQNLNRFLGSISEDEQEKTEIIVPNYKFHARQAKYLNQFIMENGYSFQKINQNGQEKVFKSRIALKQPTISKYLVQQNKLNKVDGLVDQIKQQEKLRLNSSSYLALKIVMKQLISSEQVNNFFKQSIDKVMCYQGPQKYYFEYKSIIEEPLDLNTINEMIQMGRIKNLMEFEAVFNQMIINSILIHTHLNNSYMIQCTNQFNLLYHQTMIKHICPQVDEIEKLSIKTTSFQQRPKSKKISVQGEDKQVDYMDLEDIINKNRIKVLNHFLFLICQKNQSTLYTIAGRLKNLIHRYANDKVQIVRKQLIQNQIHKDKKQTQKALQDHPPKSPKSSKSQNTSNLQLFCYQIIPKQMSVNLFQQLKQLIKSQLKQNKRIVNQGLDQSEIIRNILYPHQDSDDFDMEDDSFDS